MEPSGRFRLIFALWAVFALLAVATGIVVLATDAVSAIADRDRMLGAGAIAILGLVGALVGLWRLCDNRMLGPLAALTHDVETTVHADPGRGVMAPERSLVAPLAALIDTLAGQRDRGRDEACRAAAAASASLDAEKTRLEAILRDLAEGVVVVGTDDRVVLFNGVAHRILSRHGEIGLGRSISEALRRESLTEAIRRMRAAPTDAAAPPVITLVATSADGRLALATRLSPVIDADGAPAGYVVSFSDPFGEATPYTHPASRPVFYDFDLLRSGARMGVSPETPLHALTYVVFDTETTGLEPQRGDAIVQIGAVRIVNGRLVAGETFDRLVDPGRPIPPRSTRIHGITDTMVFGAPDIAATLPDFRAFVADAVLVGQNAAFDMAFLSRAIGPDDAALVNPVLDTMLLSMHLHGAVGDHTLDGLAARLGVTVDGRHTALGDARVTAAIFIKQIDLLATRGITTLGAALDATRRASRTAGLARR